ncbi:MAG: choice-of-anchor B family protein [Rhodothermales bacterium]|nr:choice-of-anchor B family protein [Rhodothermales bacterium]
MRPFSLIMALGVVFLFSPSSAVAQEVLCENGVLENPNTNQQHACEGMKLMSHVSPSEMGFATGLNDIWGWSDSETGKEFILSGWRDGISVLDVTDPTDPKYVALIPRTQGSLASTWRDVKIYQNHAYIVAESDSGPSPHGVQVIDLSVLREHSGDRIVLQPVTVYDDVWFAHNIVINEESGFAYAVGGSGGNSCGGGLHAIDLTNPAAPVFAGCIIDTRTARGYAHDAQCVMYNGPDVDHQGQEICIGSNENAISIVDVTEKLNPKFLGVGGYPSAQYVHQAWLSEDHKYLFQNDELDELRLTSIQNTRTLVWDITDLDDPIMINEHFSANESIDHNLYVRGDKLFQSNYIDGLHVLDISDPKNLTELAFFDTHPQTFTSVWNGTWSNYPYLNSGAVAVNSDPDGIFILCLASQDCSGQASVAIEDDLGIPSSFSLEPAYPNPFNPQTMIRFELNVSADVRVTVSDALGREVAELINASALASGMHTLQFNGAGLPSGTYVVRMEALGQLLTQQIVLLK